MVPEDHARRWILANHPEPGLKIDIKKVFKLVPEPLFELKSSAAEDQSKILVSTRYLANAPGQRVLLEKASSERQFMPFAKVGETVRFSSIVEVIKSNRPDFQNGDLLHSQIGWTESAWIDPVDNDLQLQHIPLGSDPTEFFSLSSEALAAYFGLLKVGGANSSDGTVIVSAAAGATGSVVCQIAKHVLKNKAVIGITGSHEKSHVLRTQCGCDVALNYNDPDFVEQLKKATPKYVDVFFDNVGGEIMERVMERMAVGGRVVSCGSVSSYDGLEQRGLSAEVVRSITTLRLSIRGFIFFDYVAEFTKAQQEIRQWIKDGKLRILKTIYTTCFDGVPHGIEMVLNGENTGSLVTRITE